ncbi:hypothetical protein TcCL_NonESM13610 [Trypanosoma cruzi]|uniref:Uncharacterized protein n=1 Tax=Trypanosoma cruzi (strain CL Brener) TaxID=353153 RepID=Q4D2D0_TRYCC|nr:hypothetical protein, conserved [Trypanosoma cruzi]EAN86687.1 hypothetical protein, conserved [Trypanosoma cruzi]RNC37229.1 hypothetical protein TcCL_NonESM13610 [Trypanosoma cruzi]|eukprot:XP_808538.1 hypothetical protein [Trypanosoma cruzi strain CL Brener]
MVHHISRSLPPNKNQEPILKFLPSVYSVGIVRETIGSFLSLLFIASLIIGIGAPYFVGIFPPNVVTWVEQNRTMIIAAGFVANLICGSILQSGAFEMFMDDTLIFSKLQQNKMLSAVDLAEIVIQALVHAPE